jgi:2-phosphosulfolactate phosphatase
MYEPERHKSSIVVIIDILRATSAICSAFANGVKSIIPVESIGEAKDYKSRGYLVAAERDGIILDFADFGNSPFNFTRDKIEGRTLVYSTTNGTGIIKLASSAAYVVIGSFLNITALTGWLLEKDQDVILFCAGWKNRFNLEDSVCAGAFAEKLMDSRHFDTICDSTKAAIDLWGLAKNDLRRYIDKAAHRSRLKTNGLDDCIDFCLTPDYTDKIPVVKDGVLVDNIL